MNSFGGFATKYIKGRFFMDVHPPLAKLLITLAGWLAGFKGDFDFKEIGKDYLEPGVPYVAMRMLPAILGVLTVPIMFLTLKATGCRTNTAVLGAGAILFGMPSLWWEQKVHLLTSARKRIGYAIPVHPLGFSPGVFHSSHCTVLHLLYQSAGIGAITCLPRALVVLAGCHWIQFGCHFECQVGWSVYSRLGGFFDYSSTVGGAW